MRRDRRSLEISGFLLVTLVGGCSSSDVEPMTVGPTTAGALGVTGATATTGGSTTATSGAGGSTTSAGGAGTTGTTATTGGSTTTTSGVGGSTTSAGPTTTGTSVVTSSATTGTTVGTTTASATTGAGGSSTVSTTSGLGCSTSTTDGTGGTAMACNDGLSGEEFFKRPTECALCHGEDALGVEANPNGALGAGPEVRHVDPDYVRWIVRNGRMDHPDYPDGMDAYDTCIVTDQMLEEIIAFLNSFPNPTDGAGLFNDYCANCHGLDGRGGPTERDLDGLVRAVAMVMATGHNPTDYCNRSEYMPVMTDNLTQEEINVILDYLQNTLGLAF